MLAIMRMMHNRVMKTLQLLALVILVVLAALIAAWFMATRSSAGDPVSQSEDSNHVDSLR
jgi:hypothetical protein